MRPRQTLVAKELGINALSFHTLLTLRNEPLHCKYLVSNNFENFEKVLKNLPFSDFCLFKPNNN